MRLIRWVRGRPGLAERFPATFAIQLPEGAGEATVKKQPGLARTLRRIARDGPRAFYEGEIAEAMVAEVARNGGILTLEDLAGYRPVVREPLRVRWKEREILAFPPPSSGGVTLVEILNVLEGFDLAGMGAGSSTAIHHVSEAMKLAFVDRAVHLGDPDFAEIPVKALLDKAYAATLRGRIGERALHVESPGFAVDDRGTAHLSVVDAAGNAVAITGTINGSFGSFVTVPGWGILMNNEMDDFVTDPDGSNLYGLAGRHDSANRVAPGKRPLSSMAPTIVLEDGAVRFVAGSNGGPRIITSVLLTLLHHFEWGMDVAEAVSYPRFHHQWRPDRIFLEGEHPADVEAALVARGHEVKRLDEMTTGRAGDRAGPRDGNAQRLPGPASRRARPGSVGRRDPDLVRRFAFRRAGGLRGAAVGEGSRPDGGQRGRIQVDDPARHPQHLLTAHRGDALRVVGVGVRSEPITCVERDLERAPRAPLLVDGVVADQVAARALELGGIRRAVEQPGQLRPHARQRLVDLLRRRSHVDREEARLDALHVHRTHGVGEAPAVAQLEEEASAPGPPGAGRSPRGRRGPGRPRSGRGSRAPGGPGPGPCSRSSRYHRRAPGGTAGIPPSMVAPPASSPKRRAIWLAASSGSTSPTTATTMLSARTSRSWWATRSARSKRATVSGRPATGLP